MAKTEAAPCPHFDCGEFKHVPDEQGVLFGSIYVVPYEADKEYRARREAFFKSISDLLDASRLIPEELPAKARQLVAEFRAKGVSILRLDVALFRTGETRIWFDFAAFVGRSSAKANEIELAEKLPQQAFFCLKDEAHRHYHHEPSSDQILLLTRMDREQSHIQNELKWRRETLWGLARVVSQFRRNNQLYDLKKALGVLAYADAFQTTLGRVLRIETPSGTLERHHLLSLYDFAHLRASVEASESLATWKRSGALQAFAAMSAILLSSLALWAGAVQIRSYVCPDQLGAQICPKYSQGAVSSAVVSISNHPLEFTASIVVLGYAVFLAIFRDYHFVPFGRLLARVPKALGATLSRRLSSLRVGWADTLGYFASLAVLGIVTGWLVYEVSRILGALF